MSKPDTSFAARTPTKLAVEPTPIGCMAFHQENFDGAPDAEWPSNCVGYGQTPQEAVDNLCRHELELPYSLHLEDV